MEPNDKFDRFGFRLWCVTADEINLLKSKDIKISVLAHGSAYFDYQSEYNKAVELLGRTRQRCIC